MKQNTTCDCEVIHEQAVATVRAQLPPMDDFVRLVNLYKQFSDCTRLKILWALDCQPLCVCDLAALLGITKSAVSHQLKLLRLANLVRFEKQGKVVFYALSDDHVKEVFQSGFAHIHE